MQGWNNPWDWDLAFSFKLAICSVNPSNQIMLTVHIYFLGDGEVLTFNG